MEFCVVVFDWLILHVAEHDDQETNGAESCGDATSFPCWQFHFAFSLCLK